MDHVRFDRLAAALATVPSRRRLLGTLLGTALAGLLGWPESATGKKKNKNKNENKKKCPNARPKRCDSKCCKAFQTCKKGKCVDHCEDGKQNLGETDKDCGGGDCDPCPAGKKCARATDCQSGICRTSAAVGDLRCHECTSNDDCTADFTKPFCVGDRCVECRNDTDCQDETGRPHCLAGTGTSLDGTCVECLTDSECPEGEFCSPDKQCRPCANRQGVGTEACGGCVPVGGSCIVSGGGDNCCVDLTCNTNTGKCED